MTEQLRAEVCVRCGRVTHAPVFLVTLPRSSGPDGTLYQRHGCAWRACLDHIASCGACHTLGGKCGRAKEMWAGIQDSREKYLT